MPLYADTAPLRTPNASAALRGAGARAAAMSGSGSAVFGLFQKQRDAAAAVDRLSGSGWRVILTESLGRVEYAKRSRPAAARLSV